MWQAFKAFDTPVNTYQLGEEAESESAVQEIAIEKPLSLNQIRRETVIDTLKKYQVKRSIDLGCGEGNLVSLLAKDPFFDKIGGMDGEHPLLADRQFVRKWNHQKKSESSYHEYRQARAD